MNKKIIITESQYERLQKMLVETPFDQMLKNNIEVGDVIRITWKGSQSNFEVINNTSGQIIMDNIDKGSTNINYRYLLVITSLDGDDLSGKRVHKTKEADKLDNPKSWSNISVKDITNIEVIRNGKVIDEVDPVSPSAEKQQKNLSSSGDTSNGETYEEINNNLAIILEQLKEGNGFRLVFSNTDVIFCCVGRTGNVFDLEISENKSITSLNKWDSFSFELKDGDDLFTLNKLFVKTIDSGKSFSLKFNVRSGDNNSQIWLNSIVGVSVNPNCDSKEEDGTEENKEEQILSNLDPSEVAKIIAADKNLQKAFYSQPSFWSLLKAELTGKKAMGKGMIAAFDLIRGYKDKTVDERLGAKFVNNQKVLYRLTEYPIDIQYIDKNGKSSVFERKVGIDYLSTVKSYTFDEDNEKYRVLENSEEKSKILVKEPTDEPNIFNCDIIKEYIINDEVKSKKEEDIKIKFYDSNGYKATKTK
jgi:hypothetical protein